VRFNSVVFFLAASLSAQNLPATLRNGTFGTPVSLPNPFKLLVWNIDRGSDFSEINQTIRDKDPAVCLLQEVDWKTQRTGHRDVAADLARELSLSYVWGLAFQELNQGTSESPAWQGQANLFRAAIPSSRVIQFQHQTGFWKPEPYLPSWFPQRRLGGRIALVSEIPIAGTTLVFYNLHLESRGPGFNRYEQLKETLDDADKHYTAQPVIVAGDLNTKYAPQRFVDQLQKHGFHNCFATRVRTHRIYGDLDWIFVRGPVTCEAPLVEHRSAGSDHFPLTATIRVTPR
jgi:endonuclease/exonuclease/phosphatase family metal-dependent hydrolase